MDVRRLQRCADKLDHAARRLEDFAEWSPYALEDSRDLLASYKALQEAVDSVTDVAGIILAASRTVVRDDASNLGRLADRGAFSPRLVPALRELIDLRHDIVHEPEVLNDRRTLRDAARLLPALGQAMEDLRRWLSMRRGG